MAGRKRKVSHRRNSTSQKHVRNNHTSDSANKRQRLESANIPQDEIVNSAASRIKGARVPCENGSILPPTGESSLIDIPHPIEDDRHDMFAVHSVSGTPTGKGGKVVLEWMSLLLSFLKSRKVHIVCETIDQLRESDPDPGLCNAV